MAEPTPLCTGVRVWRASGDAATVTAVNALGVHALIDGERQPVPLDLREWRLALTCDYCTRPAEVQLLGGQPGDVLCKGCSRDHFDRPADWVRPLPRTVIRQLYRECERLR
jgi:hypothetical protein